VVARIDDQFVTADDLRDRFQRGPVEVRLRSMRKRGRHYLLDLVIDETLLEREARRRELVPCFTDIHEAHRPLMERFLAAEFEPTFTPDDVPEAEVLAEYQRIRNQLAEPPRRKVHVVATESAEEARELIGAIGTAMDRNVEPEVYRLLTPPDPLSGASQSGLFDRGTAETYLGVEVAEAAFNLDGPGVHPEPVPYHEGWAAVVVRLVAPASPPPPYEQVEPQMRSRTYDSLRNHRLDSFVESFLENHRVRVNYDAMSLIPWTASEVSAPDAGPRDRDASISDPLAGSTYEAAQPRRPSSPRHRSNRYHKRKTEVMGSPLRREST
jgi:hypothetical protein